MTDNDILPIFRQRRSPYVFDPRRTVARGDLDALFEAARWAMSSYNAQPWRYIVGVKADNGALWQAIHDVLVEGNKPWTAFAPVLVLGIIETTFEHNGKPNKAATHDLGAASAFLTMEATARGLSVHQMIGIEPEQAHAAFGLTDSQEAYSALAIGYEGENTALDAKYVERDRGPRERKPLHEIIIRR
ncbi:nitroreductase family protein [Parahaliea mediterranea]|uniref:Nitroreductase family protein n=1 Tax=Parahaliea mediterranea TaxID=651086 RepID=A0A939DHI3_9GAMM|nr:nitroreductase family protein [Parahaliea mediterranea]MBN7797577.1 nitroreductase family protein [Parahaliea mediterranea]